MPIRDDIKDRVQQATDIVRLIGEQIALRPKGRERVGLCPFHDDKTPSLNVSPSKQIYKCFSCGAGGDCFSFVMNYHKMSFPEALRHLADRAGIEIPKADSVAAAAEGESVSQRKRIAAASGLALEFFRVMLRHAEHGTVARQYLENRGISSEMQTLFQIGYAPDRWDGLVQMIQSRNWDRRGFELAGLVSPRNDGSHYDRLRHRLVFPIFDSLGRPIAFGGRKLREEDEPKYLNSPEHALFNKSATLYGLHLAKKAIIDARVAVVVEGYTDVIACHQRGEKNVVATLGTALTRQHVAELRRFADKVVLIFDADAAGDKAADRAVELFLTGDLDVAIARLPSAPGTKTDPFDLMQRDDGVDLWREAVARAQDALDYQLEQVRHKLEAADTVTGRQRVMEDYLAQVAQLGLSRAGAVRRAFVVQRLGELLKVPGEQVHQLLKQHDRAAAGRRQVSEPDESTPPESPIASENWGQNDVAPAVSGRKLRALELAERQIIGALLREPRLFDRPLADGRPFDETVTAQVFVSRAGAALFQVVVDQLAEGQDVSVCRISRDLAEMDRQDLCDLLTGADAEVEQIVADHQPQQLERLWQSACAALLDHHAEMQLRRQRQAMRDSEQDLLRYVEQRGRQLSPGRIARVSPEGS